MNCPPGGKKMIRLCRKSELGSFNPEAHEGQKNGFKFILFYPGDLRVLRGEITIGSIQLEISG